MSRPRKNNLDYFTHDVNMRNDKKMRAVRARFGLKGYAIYCMLLEIIAEENLLQVKFGEVEMDIIAGDIGVSATEIREVVDYFTQPGINLLQINDGFLRCQQLERRSEAVFAKREKTLIELREGVSETEIPVFPSETTVTVTKTPQRKGKEKETKGNNYVASLFSHWNSKKNLIHHKTFSDGAKNVLIKRLKDYSQEELEACIDAYDTILSDPLTFWYSYKHTIEAFFRNGVQKEPPFRKFLPEAEPLQNFRKKEGFSTTRTHNGRSRAPEGKYDKYT